MIISDIIFLLRTIAFKTIVVEILLLNILTLFVYCYCVIIYTRGVMSKRIFLLDNIRAVLIFLVVFGHFIEPLIVDSVELLYIYGFIYAFHMPLFAMISGFFSKFPSRNELLSLLKIFVVFEVIYGITSLIMLLLFPTNMEVFFTTSSTAGVVGVFMSLLTPIWLLWYLFALIFWKLLLFLFGRDNKMLIIAVAISLLIGFVVLDGRFLSYQRLFGMFPFFLLGFYANVDSLLKLKSFRYNFLVVLISFLLLIFVVPKVITVDVELFYYADSYTNFDMSYLVFIFYRFAILLTALMVCLSVIILIPNQESFYTKLGANTSGVYLGHGLIFLILMGFGFFEYVNDLNIFVLVSLLLVLSYVIVLFLNKEYVIKFINKITFNERIKK